jgi:integrase
LTGQRRGELTAIQDDWITDVITFPATVTKNKHEHVLPYGEFTKQFLKPYSFNGWSKSKKRLDKAIEIPHWTIHDLRRTMATIHAELGTPVHVTEKLLNHVSGTHGGIVGIYQRHAYLPEMKKAVETYETYIAKLVSL